jgi:hypothetical protein
MDNEPFIDDVPIKMVIFHGSSSTNQGYREQPLLESRAPGHVARFLSALVPTSAWAKCDQCLRSWMILIYNLVNYDALFHIVPARCSNELCELGETTRLTKTWSHYHHSFVRDSCKTNAFNSGIKATKQKVCRYQLLIRIPRLTFWCAWMITNLQYMYV